MSVVPIPRFSPLMFSLIVMVSCNRKSQSLYFQTQSCLRACTSLSSLALAVSGGFLSISPSVYLSDYQSLLLIVTWPPYWTSGEVVPHQDATFLHTTPLSVVGFWVPLQDCMVWNHHPHFIHDCVVRYHVITRHPLVVYAYCHAQVENGCLWAIPGLVFESMISFDLVQDMTCMWKSRDESEESGGHLETNAAIASQ